MGLSYTLIYIILASFGPYLTHSAPVGSGEENYRNNPSFMSLNKHIKITSYESKRLVEITINRYCNRYNTKHSICSDEWMNNSKAVLNEFDFGKKDFFMSEKVFTNSLKKLAYVLGRYTNMFKILLKTKKASLCKHLPIHVYCNPCGEFQTDVSIDYCELNITTYKLKDLEIELNELSEKYKQEDLKRLRHFVQEATFQQHEEFVFKMLTNTLTELNQMRVFFSVYPANS